MTPRHFLVAVALSFVAFAGLVLPVRAQDAAVPEVANARKSFVGRITADAVNVRSGPGDNYYATLKLDKGAEITVVGIKFDWLKIIPPEGSFSYVAKAFVEKSGNIGTVAREDVNVRTGSTLNQMKISLQMKLDKGQQVQIVDEKDEYYVIKPPSGAYVYVNKQFVEPVRPVNTQIADATPTAPKRIETPVAAPQQPVDSTPPTQDSALRTQDSALPPDQLAAADQPAATQPSAGGFEQLEAEFADASSKPIEQQPIKDLLARYNKFVAETALPESLKRVADIRIRTLTARNDVQEQFVAVQKMQEESKQRQTALKVEQEELKQQIEKNDVKMYAAVGTLRTSNFQSGPTTIYRLTDPATTRTVVYLRIADATKYAALIGEFVAVKGEITTESGLNLKVITPSEDAVKVAPDQVFKTIAAQIVPPSILPQAAQQASTGRD